eukprot:gene28831-34799_t
MSKSSLPGYFGIGSLAAFEIYEQVGEGTYGYVYKARDRKSNETVALKRLILNREVTGFPLCAVREVKFLKSLQHKNIVKLKEVVTSKGCEFLELPVQPRNRENKDNKEPEQAPGHDEGKDVLKLCGNLYFVFEFIEHDLSGLLDAKHVFPERTIKCIMKQLLEVLDYLSEKKVIHRDIKPSNLLLSSRYQLKLADFGLARHQQSTDMTLQVVTLWYRPPELLLGSRRYTTSVDTWAAGCVLAELELSRPLFPGKTEREQLELIVRGMGGMGIDEDTYPGVTSLPLYDQLVRGAGGQPGILVGSGVGTAGGFKGVYGHKLKATTLALLERILVPDPLRRSSPRLLLANKYFHSPPLPPLDPLDLPPLPASLSYHEYKTKKERKQREEGGVNTGLGLEKAPGSDAVGVGSAKASPPMLAPTEGMAGRSAPAAIASASMPPPPPLLPPPPPIPPFVPPFAPPFVPPAYAHPAHHADVTATSAHPSHIHHVHPPATYPQPPIPHDPHPAHGNYRPNYQPPSVSTQSHHPVPSSIHAMPPTATMESHRGGEFGAQAGFRGEYGGYPGGMDMGYGGYGGGYEPNANSHGGGGRGWGGDRSYGGDSTSQKSQSHGHSNSHGYDRDRSNASRGAYGENRGKKRGFRDT